MLIILLKKLGLLCLRCGKWTKERSRLCYSCSDNEYYFNERLARYAACAKAGPPDFKKDELVLHDVLGELKINSVKQASDGLWTYSASGKYEGEYIYTYFSEGDPRIHKVSGNVSFASYARI